jgi:hypothetical protein
MKVLFTGMGSNHCNRPSNTTFFTVLSDALSEIAEEVIWASPSLSWTKKDLDKFDLIIFGFIAPTSLSANKIFGALHLLGLMSDSPKLKLVVDSPQMWQYKNSVNALKRDAGILFTSFYSKREGYAQAYENREFIELAANNMDAGIWPQVVYPSMPWITSEKVSNILGFVSSEDLLGINLDANLINPEPPRIGRRDLWAVENPKNSWLSELEKILSFPRIPTKTGRKTDDDYALGVLRNSIGLIIPPQERKVGTWWNYRMFQAMNTGTPIATYWQDTYRFDPSWAALAYDIEDYDPAARQMLANSQRSSYLNAIPRREESLETLKINLLDSAKEKI